MTEKVCSFCGAPVRHELSKNATQFQCGTTVNLTMYAVGPESFKVVGLITGKCADKISIKMGVKE